MGTALAVVIIVALCAVAHYLFVGPDWGGE